MKRVRQLLILLVGLITAVASQTAPHASTAAPEANADVLPFIEDDYSKALAEAHARHLPLFIESWAPW